jgi:hypothetical protein
MQCASGHETRPGDLERVALDAERRDAHRRSRFLRRPPRSLIGVEQRQNAIRPL